MLQNWSFGTRGLFKLMPKRQSGRVKNLLLPNFKLTEDWWSKNLRRTVPLNDKKDEFSFRYDLISKFQTHRSFELNNI